MADRPATYRITELDTETRQTLSSMLGISYYTDAMIARHTGLSEAFVASARKRRGGTRPPFPTHKGLRNETVDVSSDVWIKQIRADTDALTQAILRAGGSGKG